MLRRKPIAERWWAHRVADLIQKLELATSEDIDVDRLWDTNSTDKNNAMNIPYQTNPSHLYEG